MIFQPQLFPLSSIHPLLQTKSNVMGPVMNLPWGCITQWRKRACVGKEMWWAEQSCSGRKSVSCGKDPILLIPNKQDTLQQREGVRCKNQWKWREYEVSGGDGEGGESFWWLWDLATTIGKRTPLRGILLQWNFPLSVSIFPYTQ